MAQPPDQAAELLFVRGTVLAKRGEYAGTAESGEKLARLVPPKDRPDNLYNTACLLSMASAAAETDEKLGQPDRTKLSEKYAVRAIEFLHQAKTVGYFNEPKNIGHLRQDSDLEPLRERTEFLKFLEGLNP